VLDNNRNRWYGCRCGSVGFGGGADAVTLVAGSKPKMTTNAGISAFVCGFPSGMRSYLFEGDIGDGERRACCRGVIGRGAFSLAFRLE
jgi:hypothetical protein